MQDDVSTTVSESTVAEGHIWREGIESTGEVTSSRDHLTVELTAAVIAVQHDQPVVLVKRDAESAGRVLDLLPSTRFRPAVHATLEEAIRQRVEEDTGLALGFVEQLSSDWPRFFASHQNSGSQGTLSIGHLALSRAETTEIAGDADWTGIYTYFPWEDWRAGRPAVLVDTIQPALASWIAEAPSTATDDAASRRERVAIAFGLDGGRWDDERVLDRLDILVESGLQDCTVDRHLRRDHRRTLAAALGRLRAKIRYRPVVFELLPPDFTLFELQKSVEAILGPHLHKQNFRRLVEGTGLVEPTGDVRTHTGGRPAKLFRFRRDVLLERPAPGVRVRPARAG